MDINNAQQQAIHIILQHHCAYIISNVKITRWLCTSHWDSTVENTYVLSISFCITKKDWIPKHGNRYQINHWYCDKGGLMDTGISKKDYNWLLKESLSLITTCKLINKRNNK